MGQKRMATDFDLKDLLNKLYEVHDHHLCQQKDKKKYFETETDDQNLLFS